PHTPHEYSQLLEKLTEADKIEPDEYSRNGIVEKLETRMAVLLGKESAVWLPTGTLANHLAVRLLAGPKRRVLVQAESHLYKDCGDCAQTLSGLNLIPLAPGRATFSVEEMERAATDAVMGRVLTPVGAIQIETPVRRRLGERFDFEQLTKISAWARQRSIGLHLDGARLFLEAAYSGRPVREYTAFFDTVFVSMWKYFNAASGAILAGPRDLLKDLYHLRRMFGGGLPQSWPFAAVALHNVEQFEQTFRNSVKISEEVIAILAKDTNFEIERVPNGTNIFRLRVVNVNPPVYQIRLEEAGISARPPGGDQWLALQVNATWARVSSSELVARFRKALG
ncbi:MAG: amino acid lyase, partial [Bryobacteraceae bacterium]|nr:amino acid lyase [Bryobacteraceae bacterium]